jgi:1,4-alpha-glucan branching enzyme
MTVQPSELDGDGTVLATFRLPADVGATTAHVVGDFNEWSRSANPMEADGDGFVAQVPLEPGRRYRFRYLLDGERWENDWAADDYVDNEHGGTDSVLDLTRAQVASAPPLAAEPAAPKRRARKAKAAPEAMEGADR